VDKRVLPVLEVAENMKCRWAREVGGEEWGLEGGTGERRDGKRGGKGAPTLQGAEEEGKERGR